MLDKITGIYDDYLKKLNKKNEKKRYTDQKNTVTGKKWFQISGAGSCLKKHYYKILEFKESPID